MDKRLSFRDSLRAWMNVKGETIESLADASGVSKSGVGNIMSGATKTIRGSTRKMLAKGLGIRPDDFEKMPGSEDVQRKSTVTEGQIIEDLRALRASGTYTSEDMERLLMRAVRELTKDENDNIQRRRAE